MPDVLPMIRPDDQLSDGAALPLAIDAKTLARLMTSSLRWVRTQDAAGLLPEPVRIAGRVLWVRAEVEEWLAAGCPDRQAWKAIKKSKK